MPGFSPSKVERTMDNTVKIPKFLHDFHGEQSNWLDIASIHLIAILTTIITLYLADDLPLPPWKKFLLIGLAYDLGGGVVANFTYSTNLHYDQSLKRRLVFLSLHFLQPIGLTLVFPDQMMGIVIFSAYIVAAAFIVNAIQDPQRQLTLGALLTATGIIALQGIPLDLHPPLKLLLTIFLLKLPLSFAVRWFRLKKIGS